MSTFIRSTTGRLPVVPALFHTPIPLCLLLLTGCGSHSQPKSSPNSKPPEKQTTVDASLFESIEITPSQAHLRIEPDQAAEQNFQIVGLRKDGTREQLSEGVTFSLSDTDIGFMEGASFRSRGFGGKATLKAAFGALSASATVIIDVKKQLSVSGAKGSEALPEAPALIFSQGTEHPDRSPRLVYPNDGVLIPANLQGVEFHYERGHAGHELFEIQFSGENLEIAVFTRCVEHRDGCVYRPQTELWKTISDTARGLEPVQVRIRGTHDTGGQYGQSNTIQLSISAQPVVGGLYYWSTSSQSILQVDFGSESPTPKNFFPTEPNGTCYGCHAISPDGRKMSLSQGGQRKGQVTVLNVGDPKSPLVTAQDNIQEQFQSWNPSSDKFAAVWSDGSTPNQEIRIRNGETGAIEETIAIGVEPSHPDWSPVGDRILFTNVTRHQTSQRPGRGGISYIEHQDNRWDPKPKALVPPEDQYNRYHPAFAPDGTFFLYNESQCPPGKNYDCNCDADADPSATLWAMDANGGPTIRLAHANAPGLRDNGTQDLSNTYPKWVPFVASRKRDGSGRIMWFTFSSRRHYGLNPPPNQNGACGQNKGQLLWMAAIDPEAIAQGKDGSFAAFVLPFQDITTSNHIAQWTTKIVSGGDPGNGQGNTCQEIGDLCDPEQVPACCGNLSCLANGPYFRCQHEL